jgi:predicted ATPase
VLSDAWTRALAGEIQVATLAGEAGVGKTRLVAEFASWVHGTGATVLCGSNDEDFDVPYQPFAELLLSYVQAQPDWAITQWLHDVSSTGNRCCW